MLNRLIHLNCLKVTCGYWIVIHGSETVIICKHKIAVMYVHFVTVRARHAGPGSCREGPVCFLAVWCKRPLNQAFSFICFSSCIC